MNLFLSQKYQPEVKQKQPHPRFLKSGCQFHYDDIGCAKSISTYLKSALLSLKTEFDWPVAEKWVNKDWNALMKVKIFGWSFKGVGPKKDTWYE